MQRAINLLETLRDFTHKKSTGWALLAELSEVLQHDVETALSELYAERAKQDTASAS